MNNPRYASRVRALAVAGVASSLLMVAACQQKMAHQPYYRPLEESAFFPDGRSARPLEFGTVSVSQEPDDSPLVTGLTPQGRKIRGQTSETIPEPAQAGAPSDPANYVSEFPFKLKEDDIRRGMERYTIFCTPCHGPKGDGYGKIVERGYLRPPTYYPLFDKNGKVLEGTGVSRGFGRFRVLGADGEPLLLRDVPIGYFYEVISRGFGGMPDHSAQIPPVDRWRIAAYIRVLQLSQGANVNTLPEAPKADALKKLGEKQ
jgi:hypothetical protein